MRDILFPFDCAKSGLVYNVNKSGKQNDSYLTEN